MKKAIIYLHGFNSASLDLAGKLLTSKPKLVVLERFCLENKVKLCSPNVDYRHFELVVRDQLKLFYELESAGYKVLFMGSSLGGFSSEYLAMKTQTKAIMINPATLPSELLLQFIGENNNTEINQVFDWTDSHCKQFKDYESELIDAESSSLINTVLLDMGDELIDSEQTRDKYQDIADVITFAGGSHGFEHMEEALPAIERTIFSQ